MTEAIVVGLVGLLACIALAWRAKKNNDSAYGFWKQSCGRMYRIEALEARLRDVEPREARFRQALGYYANELTWSAEGRQHSPAFKDRGRIARDALK